MIEEALPFTLEILSRLLKKELRESLAKSELDFVTGEGDVTLNEQIASHPGCDILHPTQEVRQAEPADNESVFSVGKDYLDMMASTHLFRGALCVPGAGFLWLSCFMFYEFSLLFFDQLREGPTFGTWLFFPVILGALGLFSWFFWYCLVSFDWFHYRANPIRFDRRRRMVHVWRSRRAGGCYSVPWDDNLVLVRGGREANGMPYAMVATFFCIDPATGRIKRRIAVGKPTHDREKADALYEYIRRFMEHGRSAVPESRRPARMTPSLAYSFNAWFNFTDMAELRRKGEWTLADWFGTLLLIPWFVPLSLSHFIAMLTSRTPKWPKEMS